MDEFESFDRREARESALAFIATLLLLGSNSLVGSVCPLLGQELLL